MPPESPPTQYWFPAKRYGWGWGPPRTWQGWAVTGGYCAVVIGAMLVGGEGGLAWKLPVVLGASVVLLLVCLRKGEPTRWRWGSK